MNYPKITTKSQVSNPNLGFARPPLVGELVTGHLIKLREGLSLQVSKYLPSPEAELVSGVLWGEKANLPKDFNDALKRTGTIHIVVVSGYNIALVAGVLLPILTLLGRRKAAFLTIMAIVLFVTLTGAEAPAVRAGIMGGLVVLGKYFGRERSALRLLVVSAVVMLLINPLYIDDLGFKLSFLATLGILLFGDDSTPISPIVRQSNKSQTETWTGRLKKLPFYSELRTTLAAQVLVLPLLTTTFGELSIVSPFANLAVSWTIPYLMVTGLLLTLLGGISSLLGKLLGAVVTVPASFFVWAVTTMSKVSWATLQLDLESEIVITYYLSIFVLIFLRKMAKS